MDENNENGFNLTDFSLIIYVYLTPVVIIIGVVGNLLCLIVFQAKRLGVTSTGYSCSIFLTLLSIADLLILCINVVPEWMTKGLPHITNSTITFTSEMFSQNIFCELYLLITNSIRLASVWLLVLFTIERYIGVCHPLKRHTICRPRRIFYTVLWLVIFSFLLCSINSFYSSNILDAENNSTEYIREMLQALNISGLDKIKPNKICGKSARFSVYFNIFYAMLIAVIPPVLLMVFNMCIARCLLKQWNYRNINLSASCSSPNSHRDVAKRNYKFFSTWNYRQTKSWVDSNSNSYSYPNANQSNLLEKKPKKRCYSNCFKTVRFNFRRKSTGSKNGEIARHPRPYRTGRLGSQYFFMLLSISICFIILNLPYCVAYLSMILRDHDYLKRAEAGEKYPRDNLIAVFEITKTLFSINYCANFFLYSLSGRYFRRELFKIFHCSKG